jgi:hypothetical protein
LLVPGEVSFDYLFNVLRGFDQLFSNSMWGLSERLTPSNQPTALRIPLVEDLADDLVGQVAEPPGRV